MTPPPRQTANSRRGGWSARRRTLLGIAFGVTMSGCWRPAPIDMPAPHLRPAEEIAEPGAPEAAPDEEPTLNPDPDGLDPYAAITVNSPLTIVDDAGKPVTVINTKGVKVEVREEDGQVRRKVYCASCSPAGEGWLRTEDIAIVPVL